MPGDGPPPTDESSGNADEASDATSGTRSAETTRSLGGGLTVSLNRTAVPGARVTVTVTRDGEPVAGARVAFDTDSIGRTDESGTVVGRLPYAESVTVSVRTNGSAAAASTRWPLPPPTDAAVARQTNATTYDLTTTATVTVVGEPRPNGTVTIVATIADVPLRNATVRLDGDPVGRTDRRGRVDLRLPAEAGTRTISVDRGPATGTRRIEIPGLRVDRSIEWPVALPFAPVTVTASRGDEPANATIAVNDRRVGTTGVDGERTVRLPLASQAAFVVTADGQRVTTTIGGLYARTAGVGGVGVAVVLGASLLARRRGVTLRELPLLVERAVTTLVALLVVAASGLSAVVGRAIEAGRAALAERDPGVVVRRLLAGLAATAAWLYAAVGTPAESARSAEVSDTPANGDARDRIRAAWRGFVSSLDLRGATTRTPGEVARRAIAVGLPAEPVARLRDAYRAVEYGGEEPTEKLATVRRAVEAIRGDEE